MAQPAVTYEQLIAFAAGALTGPDAQAVERYVSRNADAAATVARFRLVQERVASDDSVEPSPQALARAHRIFSEHRSQPEGLGWLDAVDRFIARLIFDSRVTPMAVRSSALEQRINLTFELAEGELDLQAETVGDVETPRWRLMGQVSNAGLLREVALAKAGSTALIAHACADEHGAFEIEAPAGRYDLHLRFDDGQSVAGELALE